MDATTERGDRGSPAPIQTEILTEQETSRPATPTILESEQTMARMMNVLQTLAINDTNFTPTNFQGEEKDTGKTEKWLEYFQNYAAFRGINENAKLNLFKLLLTGKANDWIRSLPTAKTNNWESLIVEFRQRFSTTDLTRWQMAASMWTRTQSANEPVDCYITDIINMANVVPIVDKELIRFAIIKGLHDKIKVHVIQSEAKTIEEVIRTARVAEAALTASDTTATDVSMLSAQMAELMTMMKASAKNTSIATVTTTHSRQRSPSPAPNRVNFDDIPNRRPENRPPATSPSALRRTDIDWSTEREPQQPYSQWEKHYQRDNRSPPRQAENRSRPLENNGPLWPPRNADRERTRMRNSSPTWQQRRTFNTGESRPLQRRSYGKTYLENVCTFCGVSHRGYNCRVSTLCCFKCNRPGHLAHACDCINQYQRGLPQAKSGGNNTKNVMITSQQSSSIFARVAHGATRLLIDTGAAYSCLSESLCKRLQLPMQQPGLDTPKLVAANGQPLMISGTVEVNVCINSFNFGHKFIVLKDLRQQGLIGIDFLQSYRGDISIAQKTLFLMDGLVATPLIYNDDSDNTVTLAKRIQIPPHTEAKIPVAISHNYKPQLSLIEGNTFHINHIMVARCLVKPRSNETVCQIMNTSNQVVTLNKGYKIATILPINEFDPENKRLLSVNFEKQTDNIINSVETSTVEEIAHEGKLQALQNLGINFSKTELEKQEFQELIALIYEYKELFATSLTDLPVSTLPEMKITLTSQRPFRLPQYRLSPAMQDEVNRQCDELLSAKIIRKSTSPYNSPLLVVKKFDNKRQISGYRICLDLRTLNKLTVPEFTCMESIASCRDKISQLKPKIFTTLDQKAGYHSIQLAEESKPLTAFSTSNCKYEYNRSVFGARNSGSHFSRAITDLLKPHQNKQILAYVDDLCLISQDFKSHIEVIKEVFQKYRQAKIRFNPDKANFACKSIIFLGLEFSEAGCRVNPQRFDLIRTWKRPQNVKQLRTWLGMTTYFRSFIRSHSQLTWPLRKLLINDEKFIWGEEQEKAFNQIKDILISDVTLEYPDLDKEFILETDASIEGLGYCLKQVCPVSKKEKVIEFGGRSLRKYEKNMSVYKLEILALINAIESCRMYLQSNREFLVRTDNMSVSFLKSLKFGKSQQIRWSIFLDQFNFRIVHLAGSKNSVSDALSRREYEEKDEENETPVGDGIDMNAYIAQIENAQIDDQYFETTQTQQQLDRAKARHRKLHSHTISLVTNDIEPLAEVTTDPVNHEDSVSEETTNELLPNINLESQRDDNLFNSIIKYLTEDNLPKDKIRARDILVQAENYVIVENRLVHIAVVRSKQLAKVKPVVYQICVPRQHRMMLLKAFHDDMSHCHGDKLYLTLRNKFYYKSMYADCMNYANSCQTCPRIKGASITPAPLRSWRISKLFANANFDHHGPISSKNPNHPFKYILVVVDQYSMNTRFIPVKDTSAKCTCEALVNEYFIHYGIPETLTSDCSSVYMSNLAQELFKMLKIKHVNVSPYSPSSNGRVEALNSHFLKCIRALETEELDKWPSYLPLIEMSHRFQHSKSLNCSPFYALYCQEPRTIFDAKVLQNTSTPAARELNKQFLPRVTLMRKILAENLEQANTKTMETFNKQPTARCFKLGDRVYRKSHKRIKGVTASHTKLFEGPFIIVEMERENSVNVKLANLYSGKVDKYLTHVNQLKIVKDGRDILHEKYRPKPTGHDISATDKEQPVDKEPPRDSRPRKSDSQPAADSNHSPPHGTEQYSGNRPSTDTDQGIIKRPKCERKAFNRKKQKGTRANRTRHKKGGLSVSDDAYEDVDQNKPTVGQTKKQHATNHYTLTDTNKADSKLTRDLERQNRINRREASKQIIPSGQPDVHKRTTVTLQDNTKHAETTNTDDSRNRNTSLNSAPMKIIKRRKFGKQMKYHVKLGNDDPQWLDASNINQSLLSEYNVKRYQKLQAKKRRTLNLNQR
jgi:hypothetical protein